ncbi:MAG: MazG family protein [Chloroflexi bacterium]|nr:MazG family protein [Chloroflexota bacterium]
MAADAPSPDREPHLDALLDLLGLAPERVQSLDPSNPRLDAARPLLVLPAAYAEARPLLAERYPAAHPARVVEGEGARESTVELLSDDARAWLIAPLTPEQDHRSLAALRSIVEQLYAPGGCPWDRDQTHESLRRYLLEESYEVAEAIDAGDASALREELGDLLVQILMHCAMAQEAREFTLEEVVREASLKMLRRHPHVFGDESAADAEAVAATWDEIKAAERSARGEGGPAAALDAVPRAAPALLRAQALQGRAERAGAPQPPGPPAAGVLEALRSLQGPGAAGAEALVGELLWAVVALAREHDVDAESALRASAAAFVGRIAGEAADEAAPGEPAGTGADATLAGRMGAGARGGRPG